MEKGGRLLKTEGMNSQLEGRGSSADRLTVRVWAEPGSQASSRYRLRLTAPGWSETLSAATLSLEVQALKISKKAVSSAAPAAVAPASVKMPEKERSPLFRSKARPPASRSRLTVKADPQPAEAMSGDGPVFVGLGKPKMSRLPDTEIQVKSLSGDLGQWGRVWKGTSPHIVDFRWKTRREEASTAYAELALPNFNGIGQAVQVLKVPSAPDQWSYFSINFRKLLELDILPPPWSEIADQDAYTFHVYVRPWRRRVSARRILSRRPPWPSRWPRGERRLPSSHPCSTSSLRGYTSPTMPTGAPGETVTCDLPFPFRMSMPRL
jgi:hypothetical protein